MTETDSGHGGILSNALLELGQALVPGLETNQVSRLDSRTVVVPLPRPTDAGPHLFLFMFICPTYYHIYTQANSFADCSGTIPAFTETSTSPYLDLEIFAPCILTRCTNTCNACNARTCFSEATPHDGEALVEGGNLLYTPSTSQRWMQQATDLPYHT